MISRFCFVRVTLAAAPPWLVLLRWRTSTNTSVWLSCMIRSISPPRQAKLRCTSVKPCAVRKVSAASSAAAPLRCLLVRVAAVLIRANKDMPASVLLAYRNGNTILIHRLGFAALKVRRCTTHIDVDLTGNSFQIKAGTLPSNLSRHPEGVNAKRIQARQISIGTTGSRYQRLAVSHDHWMIGLQLPGHIDQMHTVEFG